MECSYFFRKIPLSKRLRKAIQCTDEQHHIVSDPDLIQDIFDFMTFRIQTQNWIQFNATLIRVSYHNLNSMSDEIDNNSDGNDYKRNNDSITFAYYNSAK